ncbi:MAG: hypothetical protein AAGJ81_09465 [Verrucomicrobiota bacterium]
MKSLLRQSEDGWCSVVVGHEQPDLPWSEWTRKIVWIESSFDLPPLKRGGSYSNYADFDRILDKQRKISLGMRHLQQQEVTDWFVLDADDYFHRNFVKTYRELPQQAGWLVNRGYIWYADIKRWSHTDRLLNLCGSTAIISASLFDLPRSDDDNELRKIPWCRLSHSDMEAFLRPHLSGASPFFPLSAVAYTLSHGDNCSDEFRDTPLKQFKLWVKKRLTTRKLDREFTDKFGVR